MCRFHCPRNGSQLVRFSTVTRSRLHRKRAPGMLATYRSIRSRCFLSEPRDPPLPATMLSALWSREFIKLCCPFALRSGATSLSPGDLARLTLLLGDNFPRLRLPSLALFAVRAPAPTGASAEVTAAAADEVGTGGLRWTRYAPPATNRRRVRCVSRRRGNRGQHVTMRSPK